MKRIIKDILGLSITLCLFVDLLWMSSIMINHWNNDLTGRVQAVFLPIMVAGFLIFLTKIIFPDVFNNYRL